MVSLVSLTSAAIPTACASEGEPDAVDQRDASFDASGDISSGDVEAGDQDAGPRHCSSAKLCVSPLPIEEHINLTAVWGSGAADVWAVGSSGTVMHYDGLAWEKAGRTATTDASVLFTLRSVWLERPDDVWIADSHSVRHTTQWRGPSATEWSVVNYPTYVPAPSVIRGRGDAIWLARGLRTLGSGDLTRFQGWRDEGPNGSEEPSVGSIGGAILAMVVLRSEEVWFSTSQGSPDEPAHMQNRVFRARLSYDDGGVPDGNPPTVEKEEYDSQTRQPLHGAWGDEHAIWFVGSAGTVRRIVPNGSSTKTLDVIPGPVIANLYGVFGFGADDVWAVGESSTVLHWDGTSWTKLSTPFDDASKKPRLLAVWGSSPADVWIAGDGTILRYQENAR